MPANNNLDLVSLDFDAQKASLQAFLQGQSQLRDYDFLGSSLNVLLDLLSVNTQKNAFYLNMNVAESFLDTAQLRDSILSHAKDLNYTARSARSARAHISVTFQATQESQPYIIPQGASFTTLIKARSFIFSIPQTLVLSSANSTYTFETDIYEGIYLKDTYIFASDQENQRFRISNPSVDTESISIKVYEDNKVVPDIYTLKTSLLDLTSISKVFFLQCSENNYYEILFGNGVIGRKPKRNSVIVIEYRVSSASMANGARSFVHNFDPTGPVSELLSNPVCTTIDVAQGGADPETNESIRYIAPRHFQVQERAVIESDAEVLLKEEFPEINAVSVFGGEKVNPPRFGKIFVSVDIADVYGLPDSKKTEYYNFLKRRCNLAIRPIIIQPEFTYIDISSLVRYNVNISNMSEDNIRTLVVSAIMNYNKAHLNDFKVVLRYSNFLDMIDNCDPSIVSNITTIRLYKYMQPSLLSYQNLSLDFATPLQDDFSLADETNYSITNETTLSSSSFRFNGQAANLADDGNGVIRIVKNDGKTVTKITNIGTIDYSSGKINLSNFFIENYEGNSLIIYVKQKDMDITAAQNTILSIEPNQLDINVELLNL